MSVIGCTKVVQQSCEMSRITDLAEKESFWKIGIFSTQHAGLKIPCVRKTERVKVFCHFEQDFCQQCFQDIFERLPIIRNDDYRSN